MEGICVSISHEVSAWAEIISRTTVGVRLPGTPRFLSAGFIAFQPLDQGSQFLTSYLTKDSLEFFATCLYRTAHIMTPCIISVGEKSQGVRKKRVPEKQIILGGDFPLLLPSLSPLLEANQLIGIQVIGRNHIKVGTQGNRYHWGSSSKVQFIFDFIREIVA